MSVVVTTILFCLSTGFPDVILVAHMANGRALECNQYEYAYVEARMNCEKTLSKERGSTEFKYKLLEALKRCRTALCFDLSMKIEGHINISFLLNPAYQNQVKVE